MIYLSLCQRSKCKGEKPTHSRWTADPPVFSIPRKSVMKCEVLHTWRGPSMRAADPPGLRVAVRMTAFGATAPLTMAPAIVGYPPRADPESGAGAALSELSYPDPRPEPRLSS